LPGAAGRRDDALECTITLSADAALCRIELRRAARFHTEVQYQTVSFTLNTVLLGGAHPGRQRNVPQQIRY
jgi:hypothetical protein